MHHRFDPIRRIYRGTPKRNAGPLDYFLMGLLAFFTGGVLVGLLTIRAEIEPRELRGGTPYIPATTERRKSLYRDAALAGAIGGGIAVGGLALLLWSDKRKR